jgi:hypothetical protein
MDAIDLRANLTFRHLKGMKLEPSQYKTIPFSLFPTAMAKEDILRLILVMALMDDVFESGLRTWTELMTVPSFENGRCFHPPCAQLSKAGKSRTSIVFQSKEERISHMMTQHQLISTTSPKPVFCEFCYEFVLPHELDAHFELYIDATDLFVKANGYIGLIGLGRTLMPRLCIFCYHDKTLCVSQRLDTQCNQRSDKFQRYIDMHLKAIKHAIPCPAYPEFCTLSECLDSTKIRNHLARVHGIIIKEKTKTKTKTKTKRKRKRKRKRKDEDGDEDGDENDHEVDEVAL